MVEQICADDSLTRDDIALFGAACCLFARFSSSHFDHNYCTQSVSRVYLGNVRTRYDPRIATTNVEYCMSHSSRAGCSLATLIDKV